MNSVVTALTTGITPTVIFSQVASIVPVLVIAVPVALGLGILRKVVSGLGKGKAKF